MRGRGNCLIAWFLCVIALARIIGRNRVYSIISARPVHIPECVGWSYERLVRQFVE